MSTSKPPNTANVLPADYLTPAFFARVNRFYVDEHYRIAKKVEFGVKPEPTNEVEGASNGI